MRPVHSIPWVTLLLAVPLLGCATQNPTRPDPPAAPDPAEVAESRELPPALQTEARAVIDANNRFAFDVYHRLRAPGGNLFLSPFSIATAFAMAYAGAAGGTAEEMAQVFHHSLAPEKLHPAYGALLRSLERGSAMGGYELRVANRTWGQRGLAFVDEFLRVTREDYGAEMQQADFVRAPEAERQTINSWVEKQTKDRIKGLFPSGSINPETRLVLANAIYFKGLWAAQFDPSLTRDGAFSLNASQRVTVPIMHRGGEARLVHFNEAQMLELRYLGDDLSMLVLLPYRIDGLEALEASLTPEALDQAIAGLRETGAIPIALPRFRIESKFPLNATLAALGMPSAFEPFVADFSGIDGARDLFISSAIHQAFVEVNEEGTEAAAATGISVGATSIPTGFIADHPFLFLIRDNLTGSILFMGRVADPRG